jgi:hypothetical protein
MYGTAPPNDESERIYNRPICRVLCETMWDSTRPENTAKSVRQEKSERPFLRNGRKPNDITVIRATFSSLDNSGLRVRGRFDTGLRVGKSSLAWRCWRFGICGWIL